MAPSLALDGGRPAAFARREVQAAHVSVVGRLMAIRSSSSRRQQLVVRAAQATPAADKVRAMR